MDQGQTGTRRRAAGVSSAGAILLVSRPSPVSSNSQRCAERAAAAGHSARTTGRRNALSNQSAHGFVVEDPAECGEDPRDFDEAELAFFAPVRARAAAWRVSWAPSDVARA